jgi:CRISPR-associated protein Csm2
MARLQNQNSQSGGFDRSSQSGGFNRNPQQRQGATSGQFREREEIPRPSKNEYQSQWITSSIDNALVDYAEKAGMYMAKKGLTNSKIRSIYGEIKRIQMSEFEKEKSAFILLKPKVAYALGRDANNAGLKLFKEIFDLSSNDVTDQKSFRNFCHLMEAILAYHKANGGKD